MNLCFSIFKRIFSGSALFQRAAAWISEKSKKNLSQSYGRWIVGFHEPMTSAFFALKKGAGIGGMNMSKEQTAKKERFLREVERQLLRKGLDSEMMEDGIPTMK